MHYVSYYLIPNAGIYFNVCIARSSHSIVLLFVLTFYIQLKWQRSQLTSLSHSKWDRLADFSFLKITLSIWNCHHAVIIAIIITCHWLEIQSAVTWDEYVPFHAWPNHIHYRVLVPSKWYCCTKHDTSLWCCIYKVLVKFQHLTAWLHSKVKLRFMCACLWHL